MAPARPNVTSDGGYLTFFEGVVEALETSVPCAEKDGVADARELLSLALPLVFSNLCRLAPELDLRRIVASAHARSRLLSWGEVRPHVAALEERSARAHVSSEEEDSGTEHVVIKGAADSPSF